MREKNKFHSYIVLLLAVCVLVVCFAFSAVFHNYLSICIFVYMFAQGYFVNWMETSIVSVCLCVFSLHFFIFDTDSSGFHSIFIFFLGFSKISMHIVITHTLHSILIFFHIFGNFGYFFYYHT